MAYCRSKKRQFTLVELLVVIAIMAILFGLISPVLQPLRGSKGVDASARKLHAVMLNARALAAKYNGVYAVTFNNMAGVTGTTGNESTTGVQSYTCEENWYAVVGMNSKCEIWNDTIGCWTSTWTRDAIIQHAQVGPTYSMKNDLTCFMALSYQDNNNNNWDKITSSKPAWKSVSSGATGANGYAGTFHIRFFPTGEALFVMPANYKADNGSGTADANGIEQTVAICGDGGIVTTKRRIVVNKYSGNIKFLTN